MNAPRFRRTRARLELGCAGEPLGTEQDGKMLLMVGQEEREQARAVITDALSHSLTLEDFHRRWPESDDPLIGAIFDETEDTVEHVPMSWLWFRRGGDHERFQASALYKILLVDEQLLSDDYASVASGRLLEIRDSLFKEVDLDQERDALIKAANEFVVREVAGGSAQ